MDTSGIENPSKWEGIDHCGVDNKPNDHAEPSQVER